jgi:homoserine dehydrogenase
MSASPSGSRFTIALLGGGTVGAAVARALVSRHEEWGIEIAGIAVRDVAKATRARPEQGNNATAWRGPQGPWRMPIPTAAEVWCTSNGEVRRTVSPFDWRNRP